ncbi:MAG TPA: TauD/TfdA family dioxygenase [Hyphomonadaceae bacterium]|nr:TauD/TfdA family dioxygenase [Hyphomonadaceae bacterium]
MTSTIEQPQILEPHTEWTRPDVSDAREWTMVLTNLEKQELDTALHIARAKSTDLLQIGKADFPLPTLGKRLEAFNDMLINGRGFGMIRGVDRTRYNNDEMCVIYWGVGAHLGKPWAQNKHGHLLGDVTDQGKRGGDLNARGNEIGEDALPFHCDGSDLVGLLCLARPASGGLSMVANSVKIHNDLVRDRPDIAAEFYKPQPHDFRGEEAAGAKPWYMMPVFTAHEGRLFIRYIGRYIEASQRHAEAPRLTPLAKEGLALIDQMANDPKNNIEMDFQPGDMQFVNNYHVFHSRSAYKDDRPAGKIRHLKRLWLETTLIPSKPKWFQNRVGLHWGQKPSISRLDAAAS